MKNLSNEERECLISYTLSIVGGRWKWLILYKVFKFKEEHIRYGELRRGLPPITDNVLSNYLKELTTDNIISRKVYEEVPIKVEYSLTPKGETLIPILTLMANWEMKIEISYRMNI